MFRTVQTPKALIKWDLKFSHRNPINKFVINGSLDTGILQTLITRNKKSGKNLHRSPHIANFVLLLASVRITHLNGSIVQFYEIIKNAIFLIKRPTYFLHFITP